MLGKFAHNLKIGIVGLPKVGIELEHNLKFSIGCLPECQVRLSTLSRWVLLVCQMSDKVEHNLKKGAQWLSA